MAIKPAWVRKEEPIVFQTIINGRTVRVYKRGSVHTMKKRSGHLEKVSDFFGLGVSKVTIKAKVVSPADKLDMEISPWKSEID
jgi:hypothetical protein